MRRSFFIFLLSGLVVFGLYRYFRLAHADTGSRGAAAHYTPASGPRLDLKDVQVLAALDSEYSRLIEAVVPSVVSITSSRLVKSQPTRLIDPFEFLFPNRRQRQPVEREQSSLGSGVIVSREGHILTNQHVIAGMEKIVVQLTDGRQEPAQLLGSDDLTDIAVLKIEARDLIPLPFGDSDRVSVGQLVFAIGNPFGLQETVTQGIVSAKGRRAVADSGVEFLQTDAAVNQGNSGGPLLNIRGEIVGLNSAIYSNTDSGSWLGISFAIPANTARRTFESLLQNGRVVRGFLGVEMTNLTQDDARHLGLPDTQGAAVLEVLPGSPAAATGIARGDVIRTFNGKPVADILAMRSRVAEIAISAKVELGVWRAGKMLTLTVEVAEAGANLANAGSRPAPAQPKGGEAEKAHKLLSGIEVSDIPQSLRPSLPADVEGVLITQIDPGSPAAEKLHSGDIIEEVDRRPVKNQPAFQAAAENVGAGAKALLLICRNGSRTYVVVP